MNSTESTINALFSVRYGMRGIGKGGISTSGKTIDLGLPETMSSPPWRNILTLSGLAISLIRIVICASASGGREILGRAYEDDALINLWSEFYNVILKK